MRERSVNPALEMHSDRDAVSTREAGWRNPQYECRVLLVGATWTLPGILTGLMAAMLAAPIFGCGVESLAAGVAGAVVFAMIGVWMESVDGDEVADRVKPDWFHPMLKDDYRCELINFDSSTSPTTPTSS